LDLKLRPSVVKAERVILRGNLKIGASREVAFDNAFIVVGEETRFPIDDRTSMKLTVVRTQPGLPPESVAPIIVQGGSPLDGTSRPPRPEGQIDGVQYRYKMVFEEKTDAGEIVTVSAPSLTAPLGYGFQSKLVNMITYEP
jgi:hypothetical protein